MFPLSRHQMVLLALSTLPAVVYVLKLASDSTADMAQGRMLLDHDDK